MFFIALGHEGSGNGYLDEEDVDCGMRDPEGGILGTMKHSGEGLS